MYPTPYFWKKAPFFRLLLPVVAGILLQNQYNFSLKFIFGSMLPCAIFYILFFFLSVSKKYTLQLVQGFFLYALLFFTAMFVTSQNDIRHTKNWYGKFLTDSSSVLVTINEPLLEKAKSFKTQARAEYLINNKFLTNVNGNLLLYFIKDTTSGNSSGISPGLKYGDRILISKKIMPIKNAGNPGGFNYRQYAAFHQIFHQTFLTEKDWILLPEKNIHPIRKSLFETRDLLLQIIRKYTAGNNNATGIAEALLIGYSNDLDKDLIQAYSNTGVVHIIAISGMHLGLIYWLLLWIFARIPLIKKSKWLQLVLVISFLWGFSLLTGASASVIRSAVMFTCIAIGNSFNKQSNIYNSLAASAFLMLCYNPYYLWDVGFQLSYLAVIGIITFQQPVYTLQYFKNKWIDKIWLLTAVSLSAQILTFPICIYYFHQFPVIFLLSNLIAVPLSTVILFTEIALVSFSWIPIVGATLGYVTSFLIQLMNKIILWLNNFSFAVWDKIPATPLTTCLLYATVISLSYWLMKKNKAALKYALCALLCFTIALSYNNINAINQHKLIVYNISRFQAIDFVKGKSYQFWGDTALQQKGALQNFHLKPSRINMQLFTEKNLVQRITPDYPLLVFEGKKIMVLDTTLHFDVPEQKIKLDLIILSKNQKISIGQLQQVFECKQYVLDASNKMWKIEKWKNECSSLHLQCFSVPDEGAFIYTPNQ